MPRTGFIHIVVSFPLSEEKDDYPDRNFHGTACFATYGRNDFYWTGICGADISCNLHTAKFGFFLVYVHGQERAVFLYFLSYRHSFILSYFSDKTGGFLFWRREIYSYVYWPAYVVPIAGMDGVPVFKKALPGIAGVLHERMGAVCYYDGVLLSAACVVY